MDTKLEIEILRLELIIGVISCEDVSGWASHYISNFDDIPDPVYDLSMSKTVGHDETLRTMDNVTGPFSAIEVLLRVYKKLLSITSKSTNDARKVASYLMNLHRFYIRVNSVELSTFYAMFQDADLGVYGDADDIAKEIKTYLKNSIDEGIKIDEYNQP